MMRYLITNSSESVISPLETAGGPFSGLAAGASTEVSEAVAHDLKERFGFLSVTPVAFGRDSEIGLVKAEPAPASFGRDDEVGLVKAEVPAQPADVEVEAVKAPAPKKTLASKVKAVFVKKK